jgi:hypothetical protein
MAPVWGGRYTNGFHSRLFRSAIAFRFRPSDQQSDAINGGFHCYYFLCQLTILLSRFNNRSQMILHPPEKEFIVVSISYRECYTISCSWRTSSIQHAISRQLSSVIRAFDQSETSHTVSPPVAVERASPAATIS